MSGSATIKEIDLGDGFGEAVFKVNGMKLAVHADGSVDYPNGTIHVHAGAIDAAPKAEPEIGDRMPRGHANAGWIYAGISKTTHEPFYVAPKDSGVFQWQEAKEFAAKEGSRLPSKEELNQLYDAKDKGALKGTFNVTGSASVGWYWSSRDTSDFGYDFAWAKRFSDGYQGSNGQYNDSSLRCVR
jgi:hypothetical protein